MTPCQEPGCQDYATFRISHGNTSYHFCWQHVWPRVKRWVGKLQRGEAISVKTIEAPSDAAAVGSGPLRGMRPDYGAGFVVVPGALDRESTEGSPNSTTEIVTPGEVPAMRNAPRKKRK